MITGIIITGILIGFAVAISACKAASRTEQWFRDESDDGIRGAYWAQLKKQLDEERKGEK